MRTKAESKNCPGCGRERIVRGRYLGQLDPGGGHVFRPEGLKVFKLSLVGSDIPVSDKFHVCLDCGLLWSRIDQGRVGKTIESLGKKELKTRLMGE